LAVMPMLRQAHDAFVAHWDLIEDAFLGPLRLRPLLHPLAFGTIWDKRAAFR